MLNTIKYFDLKGKRKKNQIPPRYKMSHYLFLFKTNKSQREKEKNKKRKIEFHLDTKSRNQG